MSSGVQACTMTAYNQFKIKYNIFSIGNIKNYRGRNENIDKIFKKYRQIFKKYRQNFQKISTKFSKNIDKIF